MEASCNKWTTGLTIIALICVCGLSAFAQHKKNGWDVRFMSPGIKNTYKYVTSLVANKKYLYISGDFRNIGEFKTNGLARWDGKKWFDLSATLKAFDSGIILGDKLALDSMGVLYINDINSNVLRWDGKRWDYIKASLPVYTQIEELFIYRSRLVVRGNGIYDGFAQFNGKEWIPLYPISSIKKFKNREKALEASEKKLNDTIRWEHYYYNHDSATVKLPSGKNKRVEIKYQFTRFANTGKTLYCAISPPLTREKNDIGLCRWDDSLWACITDSAIKDLEIVGTVGEKLFCNVLYKSDSSHSEKSLASYDGKQWKTFKGKTPLTVRNVLSLDNQLYVLGYTHNQDKSLNPLLGRWTGQDWLCIHSDLPEFVATNGDVLFYVSQDCGNIPPYSNIISYSNGALHNLSPGAGLGFMVNPSSIALYKNNIFTSDGTTWNEKNRIDGIAKWTDTSWEEVGASLLADSLYGLRHYGRLSFPHLEGGTDYLYAALTKGTNVGGYRIVNIYICRWDGVNWIRLGPNERFDDSWSDIQTLLAVGKDQLYVAGAIRSVDTIECNNIAFWNGHFWEALGQGLSKLPSTRYPYWRKNGIVNSLCIANNELYASGEFIQAYGSDTMESIARYDGTKWHSLEDTLAGRPGKLLNFRGELVAASLNLRPPLFENEPSTFLAIYRNKKWIYLPPAENMLGKNYSALFADSNYIYCATNYSDTLKTGGRIFRWDGNLWTAVSEPFYGFEVKDFVIKEGYLYAITDNEAGDFCSGFGILQLPKQ